MAEAEPTLDALRAAVQLACQPQNAGRIVAGRRQVLALPRAWVLAHIERVAAEFADQPMVGRVIAFIRAGGPRPLTMAIDRHGGPEAGAVS